jgi:hypothetical protein
VINRSARTRSSIGGRVEISISGDLTPRPGELRQRARAPEAVERENGTEAQDGSVYVDAVVTADQLAQYRALGYELCPRRTRSRQAAGGDQPPASLRKAS